MSYVRLHDIKVRKRRFFIFVPVHVVGCRTYFSVAGGSVLSYYGVFSKEKGYKGLYLALLWSDSVLSYVCLVRSGDLRGVILSPEDVAGLEERSVLLYLFQDSLAFHISVIRGFLSLCRIHFT